MIDLYQRFEEPAYVTQALKSDAMKRIADVEMNCGMAYTSVPIFKNGEPYSRAQHSRNVSVLVYHYTNDAMQCLAGLFHDIATPVFSHVVDFLNGDHMTQESTEKDTAILIQQDLLIQTILKSLNLKTEDVCDYHRFPIADNDMPGLSCDRLEYTLSNAVNYRFITPEQADRFLNDIRILENEAGIPELGFHTAETALEFAFTALHCGRIYSGNEDRYGMEVLARILKDAVAQGILAPEDLYTTEPPVIQKLLNSPLRERWEAFRRLHIVKPASEQDGGIAVNAKRRYIDPLIEGRGRASQYDRVLCNEISDFVNEDYSVYLKGY